MKRVELSDADAMVLGELLTIASDSFANHGCNDFPLSRTPEHLELWDKVQAANFRLTVEDMKAKLAAGDEWITDQYIEPDKAALYFSDFSLMSYFAGLFAPSPGEAKQS